ncbi:CGNR zinc finger domain-containing protein [Nocardioides sp. YIM 152315]|uniref:CGNR zinc finger domain-containing protein n=1 Tax=Nocardioides sp. YIM 152315 TaxID=3031760 RepID=UPI0023DB9414|nr:CGNR zinc finger domain-containing protein [Nocardioides sp. YIM 152315]MDF1603786.1 CGNR zinc finger domain-containing protein [Nocardioides sp. YIM 152315]
MSLANDTTTTLQAAVVLANSAIGVDGLTSVDQLDEWYAEYLHTERRSATADELEAVRAVRPILHDLLGADRDRAAQLVNELLAESGTVPQLVRHDDWDWHLHGVSPDAGPATRIIVDTAMAMIDFIREDEMSRLGICADEACTGIVLDLSRNRSRRFCSTACGNRNAVAAYRARQARG